MEDAMSVRDEAAAIAGEIAELRHAIHREPEIGLELPKTQRKVLDALDGLPLKVSTGTALTSVTAVLRGAEPGPTVLLRGDMDALPVTEATGAEFASRIDGVMHACGHDLHTAMLAGAARLLSARQATLAGNVIFMFQPGEEGYDGARHMVEAGVLEAAGTRPIAAYFAHVTSSTFPSGVVAVRPGPMMAAADTLHVSVVGAGGHGSSPHRARDPISVAAEIVTALQTLVTRQFDVFDPVVITVGSFHAGTQHNIIPERASFEATVRTFSDEHQQAITERAVRLCRGIAEAHGLRAEVEWQTLYPVTTNDVDEAAFLAETAAELLGRPSFALPHPHPGAEDFSRVLNEVPGAMAFLGATVAERDPETAPFNHAPQAMFDEAMLSTGAALYAKLAFDRLG
jgi:amidohydrolase